MKSVARWLEQLDLGKYARVFAEHDIDEEVLVDLTDNDLEKLGVTLGHRKKIMRAAAALRSDESPTSQIQAERRQLTVMFCDLVGSTELTQRFDPEDVRDVNRAYQDACKVAIEKYDGYIARYMGDGILAYFGYPVAHEDDAERGVRAGLEIVNGMREMNRDIGRQKAIELAVRVGLATGPVVVGDIIGEGASQESAVVGETPNLAARLQGIADANAVVIAPETHRLTTGYFHCRGLGNTRLKGIVKPVHAWRVLGESSIESRFQALHGRQLTPLTGRDRELEMLEGRWQLAREGSGQVVLISGEAGIGKSRLCEALQAHIASQAPMRLHYQCSPHYTHSVLYPFVNLLERRANIAPDDTAVEKLDNIEDILRSISDDPEKDVPLLATLLSIPFSGHYPPLALDPQEQKERTFELLVRLFESACGREPTLIQFEDLHWADPSTLEVLDKLIERASDSMVLMLITFRPEFVESWSAQQHVTPLVLDRIDVSERRAMLNAVLGVESLSVRITTEIISKTDGIPLFIEETARAVVEAQRETGGSARDDVHLEVPATLQDSLMARLDRLELGKRVAQTAAAIGREFSVDLLAAVCGLDASDLQGALSELVQGGLLFRRDGDTGTSYVFEHALLQDAAYSSLLLARRKPLHRRIAEALTLRSPDQASLLAYHWEQAGNLEEALRRRLEAARRASDLYAMWEATAQNLSALELLNRLPESPERLRMHLHAVLAVIHAWGTTGSVSWEGDEQRARALSHVEKAMRTAGNTGNYAALAKIRAFKGIYWVDEGSLAQAVKDADACADKSVQAEVASRYAGYLGQRGRFEDCYVHIDRSIELFEQLGDMARFGMALVGEGRCFSARSGRLDESLRYAFRAEEIARETQDLRLMAWAALVSEPYMYKGLWKETIEGTRRGLEAGFETQDSSVVLFGSAWAAIACLKLGQIDEAQQFVDEALASVEGRVGIDYPRSYIETVRALVQLAKGEAEQALVTARDAVKLAERGGYLVEQGAANRVLGQVLEKLNRREDADAALSRSLEQLGAIQSRPELAQSLLAYGRFKQADDANEGRKILERARMLFEEIDATGWIRETKDALGE